MTPVLKYTIWFAVSIIVIICVLFMTYRSSFSKDRKLVLYIVTVLMPIAGVIIYFIFRNYHLREAKS